MLQASATPSLPVPRLFSERDGTVSLAMRILINSFPKSGTHLAEAMVSAVAEPRDPDRWICSFLDNGWSNRWADVNETVRTILTMPAVSRRTGLPVYMLGHVGYRPEIAEALERMQVKMIFVYRDLLDCAVSQAYHIESDDPRLRHPNKTLYMALGSHQERIEAVIDGLDYFPGIYARWALYGEWCKVTACQVLPVRYEEMVQDPARMARRVLRWLDVTARQDEKTLVDEAVRRMRRPGVTFRKGEIGEGQRELVVDLPLTPP